MSPLARLNLGFSPQEARDIAMKTLDELGLAGFEDRITHRLSGGEKKLVALATILAMRPKILLLDEPTNNLDPKTRSHLIEILQGLDLYQVIISHDWDFLSHTTSILYKIDHGHIHRCEEDHVHVHRHLHIAGDHPHQHDPLIVVKLPVSSVPMAMVMPPGLSPSLKPSSASGPIFTPIFLLPFPSLFSRKPLPISRTIR